MPSIKDQSTVEAIARAFTGECKRNEEQAMLAVGYSKTYARGGRGHEMVYANERIKAAIARIDSKSAVKQARTVESLDEMYQQGFDVAKHQKNSTGMATNAAGIARLYGFGGDKAGGLPEGLTIQVHTDKPEGPKLSKEA